VDLHDLNDNSPQFVFDSRHSEKSYLVTISKTTAPGTGIIQIKATDLDLGNFGLVTYSLTSNQDMFNIDSETGVVRTRSSLEDISQDQLPFRLLVSASDNPGDSYESNSETTELFVNLIGVEDGVVLAIVDHDVSEMELKRAKLQEIIEEHTTLIVSIDHLVPEMTRYVICKQQDCVASLRDCCVARLRD
jgi:hypothetical protein